MPADFRKKKNLAELLVLPLTIIKSTIVFHHWDYLIEDEFTF